MEMAKNKKTFKMPHLLWIMFGIILLSCLATYLIPAGAFATNEAGQITGTDFQFLGRQTPVSPWDGMGPVTKKLYDTLTGMQMGEIEAPEGWIRTIL